MAKATLQFNEQYRYLARSQRVDREALVIKASRLKVAAYHPVGTGTMTTVLQGKLAANKRGGTEHPTMPSGATVTNPAFNPRAAASTGGGGDAGSVSRSGLVVAVQQLTPQYCEKFEPVMAQLQEAMLLASLDHPGVLKTVGFVNQRLPFQLVLEYCDLGRLDHHLRACRPTLDSPRMSLTQGHLCNIVLQVTEAMVYLQSQFIVHCNLSAGSVLVASSLPEDSGSLAGAPEDVAVRCKVYNLGQSQDIYLSGEYVNKAKVVPGQQSVRWMSPESVQDGIFTHASDVWSLSVLAYEVFTLGRTPLGLLKPQEVLSELRKPDFRLDKPASCPDILYSVMCLAWRQNPRSRPQLKVFQECLALQQHPDKLELVSLWKTGNIARNDLCLPAQHAPLPVVGWIRTASPLIRSHRAIVCSRG